MAAMQMGMSEMNGAHHKDHAKVEKLIDTARANYVAVKSGNWSDPGIWKGGKVPDNNASVLIEAGKTVVYDQVSDTRIKTISVRGNLRFHPYKDTQLFVETILNGKDGKLDIGSTKQPVFADKNTRIIFTSDRAVDRSWDRDQLSKGLVSLGKVNIYGADKLDTVALVGDAEAGDRVLTFRERPTGWQVGDRIVLAGTTYNPGGNDNDNSRFQDEVLTVTEISGNRVRFVNEGIKGDGPKDQLLYDHTRSTQVDANDLTLHAINLTRNVSFETENGKGVPIANRAHVMLMHNPQVNVVNAGFYHLGRSDKKKLVDDVGKNIDGSGGRGTNPRGRYGLHIHRPGDATDRAVIVRGNAVEGSPGWGIAHHGGHAILEDNVVFDTVGSGISAEAGDEVGRWRNNTVVKTTGIPFKDAVRQIQARERLYDFGTDGDGLWIQGAALIENQNNRAMSSNRTGMVVFGSVLPRGYGLARDAETVKVESLPESLRRLFPAGQTEVDIRDIPAEDITGFQSYNADTGLRIWGRQTNFDGEHSFDSPTETAHNGRSLVKDFKLWGNRASGATVEYSTNIDLKEGVIIARDNADTRKHNGVFRNAASVGGSFENVTISGFEQALNMEMPNARNEDKYRFTATLKNNKFINNTYNISKIADEPIKEGRYDDFSGYLKMADNEFGETAGNLAPTASFSSRKLDGLAVELDGEASFDRDPLRANDLSSGAAQRVRELTSKGIAAYMWDFDSDGKVDGYGRKIKHVFDSAGSKDVTLTVLDSQGKAASTKKALNMQSDSFVNAFENGDFGKNETVRLDYSDSRSPDEGWFVERTGTVTNGIGHLSRNRAYSNILGQVVHNQKVHRGQQTLSFRLKNFEGSNRSIENNQIEIVLWGVNGEFQNDLRAEKALSPMAGPQQVGNLPFERRVLAQQSFGGEKGNFFDWQTFDIATNLDQGYDYLVFQVKTANTRDVGDYVAIDDVSLKSSTASAVRAAAKIEIPAAQLVEAPAQLIDTPEQQTVEPAPPAVKPRNSLSPLSVAKLSFNEGKGKIATDISIGSENNAGQLERSTSWTDGISGSAVAFNQPQDVVSLKNSKDINLGTHRQRTISMWFQANDVSAENKQVLYEEGGKVRGLNMYLEDGLLHFGGWNSPESGWQGSWESTDKVSSNKWHHVALVLDGNETLQDNALTAYLDGDKVASMAASQLWAHPDRIGIGNVLHSTKFHDGYGTNRSAGLSGSIDEVEIYNDALSNQQVQQLATAFG